MLQGNKKIKIEDSNFATFPDFIETSCSKLGKNFCLILKKIWFEIFECNFDMSIRINLSNTQTSNENFGTKGQDTV